MKFSVSFVSLRVVMVRVSSEILYEVDIVKLLQGIHDGDDGEWVVRVRGGHKSGSWNGFTDAGE